MRQPTRAARSRRGFTLMELLVVMAILLILAGTSILAFRGIFAESKISIAKTQCVDLKRQLDNFSMLPSQAGNYPDPANGFQELVDKGMIARIPIDPWNMPYQWNLMPLADGQKVQPVVWSNGPNRLDEQGGGDDITSE
jgi:general secretion pathway protein G